MQNNFLEKIPVRNPDVSWRESRNGIVTVDMVNRGLFNRMAQVIFLAPKVSHIRLDAFGSFVWKQIDGERNLIEIGILVRDRFGEKAEPLYERLAEFFRQLKQNRFVSFRGE